MVDVLRYLTKIGTHDEHGTNKTLDIGNNEWISSGIWKTAEGTFLAMTYTQSKTFKNLKGAQAWHARKTGSVSK